MTRRIASMFVTVAFIFAAQTAVAQERPVVVELFTSQGCSSCPPADKLLGKLAESPNVIALAYHVDYWDYLGWKDTFASRSNTVRQHSYVGKTNREWIKQRLRGKFTPEIVVQGTDSLVGHSEKSIYKRIKTHAGLPAGASVALEMQGTDLLVKIRQTGNTASDLRVLLVKYTPRAKVDIVRGENSGKTLTYSHIVSSYEEVAKWSGDAPLDLTISNATLPSVILIQAGNGGPIIAAGQLKANPS